MPMPEIVYYRRGPNISRDRLIQQALCTCPWCNLVWEHMENPGRATYDLQRTRERLGGSHDIWHCPGCGGRSTANVLSEKRVRWTREDDLRHEVQPAKGR